jgi:hypothetical protein
MKGAQRTAALLTLAALLAVSPYVLSVSLAASSPPIPSSIKIALSYADTEGRGSQAGPCGSDCFPSPWCGSPDMQFIGASTNYNGNTTDPKNCQAGDWDTGGIMVMNTGSSPITFTNLTVAFPLPSSGGTVVPTCTAQMRPITINVWFGQQYYWHNKADPAFNQGPVTIPPGGKAIFAGTSSDNSYHCPTGNYPSTGPVNGTYDFDSSDAYYVNGCTPVTDTSSAPQITFSAQGYAATTYNDTGHVLDTGGIDTGNCTPTATDPQWGHETLGWRMIGTCGESCPGNQLTTSSISSSQSSSSGSSSKSVASSSSITSPGGNSTTIESTGATSITSSSSGGLGTTALLGGVAVIIVVIVIVIGYTATRRRRPT